MKNFRHLWMMLLVLPLAFAACSDDNTEEPVPVEAILEVEPASLSFEAEGGDKNLVLTANHAWTVEVVSGGEWLTVSPANGGAGEKLAVEVTAAQNELDAARTGKLVVKSEKLQREVSVSQAAVQVGPGTELPSAPNLNTYVINGVERAFGSVAFSMIGENPSVFATPSEGITEWMDIMACEEYFFAGMNPLLDGVEFDLMTEKQLYTFMSTLSGAVLETVAPDFLEEITAGKSLFDYDAESSKLTLKTGMILADGTTLAVNIEAQAKQQEVDVNDNVILRGAEQKPIRASFYMAEDGLTALYFTPGAISYFDEIYDTTSFFYLMLDDALCTGEPIEITTMGSGLAMMGVEDQLDPSKSWAVSGDNLQGAVGVVSVLKVDEGNYAVEIEVELDGVAYAVRFEGPCVPYDETAPKEDTENIFCLGDLESAILEGCLVKGGDVWTVDLLLANDEMVSISMPAAYFDGEIYGFSQSPDIEVYYSGTDRTMSKANGESGSLSILFDEQVNIVEIEFTNYDDCELYYCGEVEVVE